MAETARDEKYVITGEAMLSYPHLFEPEAMNEGEEPVYSACLVFEQGADLRAIRKAIAAAATEVWGNKAKSMFESGALRNPIRRDGEAKGYPEGSVFINVRTRRKPGIVGPYRGPDGKPMPITDPDEVYAGCYVRASLRAFAYDNKGNKGVSFALNNLQKLRDGKRIDGRRRAEDEFEATQDAPDDVFDVEEHVCAQMGCGKALTQAQYERSVKEFGRPMCPACLREWQSGQGAAAPSAAEPAQAPFADDDNPFADQ